MAQSLYTGWTGMATHQRALDNLGNNLANINTVGFRGSDFRFSDLLTQTISAGNPEDGIRGSSNAKTVGVGTTTGAFTTDFPQGPIETTNNPMNLAIDGNGFFVVANQLGTALTRNGAFTLDNEFSPGQRLLVIGDGSRVQGWMAQDGVITRSADTVGDILLPAQGDLLTGETTTRLELTGNLPSNTTGTDFNGVTTT
ncbi:MAG: flagellar hook-basal body complex protein, partial [Planctomycetes bacterium]|nr:flagellar hook-basal body complex protein [Planctomycetota bacterium]